MTETIITLECFCETTTEFSLRQPAQLGQRFGCLVCRKLYHLTDLEPLTLTEYLLKVGDRVRLRDDPTSRYGLGEIIATPGFQEKEAARLGHYDVPVGDPIPFYSVNFWVNSGGIENLWLKNSEIRLVQNQLELG